MSMHKHTPISLADYRAKVGQEVGVTDWLLIDQGRIDAFAQVTMDHQYIHVDPVRAKASAFGATIAHGFLTLSLLTYLGEEALPEIAGVAAGINYGMNALRFVAPVRSGTRIRGRFVLKSVSERGAKQVLMAHEVTVEVEGGTKPALVAEWLTMLIMT